MKLSSQSQWPEAIECVRCEFEAWRAARTGPGRGKIPDHLWDKAYELTKSHKVTHVTSALGVAGRDIRRRAPSARRELRSESVEVVRVAPINLDSAAPREPRSRPSVIAELTTSSGISVRLFSGIDGDSLKTLTDFVQEA